MQRSELPSRGCCVGSKHLETCSSEQQVKSLLHLHFHFSLTPIFLYFSLYRHFHILFSTLSCSIIYFPLVYVSFSSSVSYLSIFLNMARASQYFFRIFPGLRYKPLHSALGHKEERCGITGSSSPRTGSFGGVCRAGYNVY